MTKLIVLSFIFFFSIITAGAQNSKLLASCCVSKTKEEGRCSGNAYCSACTNCSRCAHCSSGGSCGVCASYSTPVRTEPRRVKENRAVNPSGNSFVSSNANVSVKSKSKKEIVGKKVPLTYRSQDMLGVASEILNLREGPGTEYEVIEELKRYDILKLIALDGEWLQVKVIESGNFGYVKVGYVDKI